MKKAGFVVGVTTLAGAGGGGGVFFDSQAATAARLARGRSRRLCTRSVRGNPASTVVNLSPQPSLD